MNQRSDLNETQSNFWMYIYNGQARFKMATTVYQPSKKKKRQTKAKIWCDIADILC